MKEPTTYQRTPAYLPGRVAAALLAIFLLSNANTFAKWLDFEFTKSEAGEFLLVDDFQRDGNYYKITGDTSGKHFVYYRNVRIGEGYLWQKNLSRRHYRIFMVDRGQFWPMQILVVTREDTCLHAYLLPCSEEEGEEFSLAPVCGPDVSANGDHKWDCYVGAAASVELNDDTIPDFVVTIGCGYDKTERGLVAFDGQDGAILWHQLTAATPQDDIIVEDIDFDGEREIIFESWGPDNGHVIDSTSDHYAYIYILNRRGEFERIINTGVRHTDCTVVYDRLRKKWAIYFAMADTDTSEVADRLARYDPLSGKIDKHVGNPEWDIRRIYSVIPRESASAQLFVSTSGFSAASFDLDLNELHAKEFNKKSSIRLVRDIDRDGVVEAVFNTRDSVWVTDASLQVVGSIRSRHYFINNIQYYEDTDHEPHVWVSEDDRDGRSIHLSYRVTRYKSPPPPPHEGFSLVTLLLIGSTGLVIGAGIVFVIVRFARPVAVSTKTNAHHAAAANELLDSLAVFAHGQMVRSELNTFARLGKNFKYEGATSSTAKEHLRNSAREYLVTVDPHLRRLISTESLDQLSKERRKTVNEITDHLRSHARAIVANPTNSEEWASIGEAVAADITKLKQWIRDTRKSLEEFFRADPIDALKAAETVTRRSLAAEKLQIAIDETVAGLNLPVFFDPTKLTAVFEEMIANAITVLDGRADAEITVTVSQLADTVIVLVVDNGPGIPLQDQPRIFDRGYSRKEAGGFGLYFVKTTLERYGGAIMLVQSDPSGTSFKLTFRMIHSG